MTNDNDSVRSEQGFDRRGLIKRAAVVGVATAWATPTIQSLAAPAFATGTQPGDCGTACLTGGGQIDEATRTNPVVASGKKKPPTEAITAIDISFGLGRLCCGDASPSEITIVVHPDAGGASQQYHFVQNVTITCKKTGNPAPGPNTASCPNEFTINADDRNKAGFAENHLLFVVTDNGEPGNEDMIGTITITGNDGTKIVGSGPLDKGNAQAHSIGRSCPGC